MGYVEKRFRHNIPETQSWQRQRMSLKNVFASRAKRFASRAWNTFREEKREVAAFKFDQCRRPFWYNFSASGGIWSSGYRNYGQRFAAFLKIWPLTMLHLVPFILWTNFWMSNKSFGLARASLHAAKNCKEFPEVHNYSIRAYINTGSRFIIVADIF